MVTRFKQTLTAVREQLLEADDRLAAPAAAALAAAGARLAVGRAAGMTPTEKRAALAPFVVQVRVRPAAYPGQPVRDRVRVLPRSE